MIPLAWVFIRFVVLDSCNLWGSHEPLFWFVRPHSRPTCRSPFQSSKGNHVEKASADCRPLRGDLIRSAALSSASRDVWP